MSIQKVAPQIPAAERARIRYEIKAASVVSDDDDCVVVNHNLQKSMSLNSKGYVQIKVFYGSKDKKKQNTKVQLHQFLAYWHPFPDEKVSALFRAAIDQGGIEISHLCNRKNCANPSHLWPESSFHNKSRWMCPVSIYINGVEKPCCPHKPRCVPTAASRAISVAKFSYNTSGT